LASSDQLGPTTILLLILGAILLLPLLTMGLGFGGMMGYGGMMGQYGTGGWWPLVGLLVPLLVLLVLVGGGYLLIRRMGETGQDPSMEELRMAYARGDLTDEEFETRREKLEK